MTHRYAIGHFFRLRAIALALRRSILICHFSYRPAGAETAIRSVPPEPSRGFSHLTVPRGIPEFAPMPDRVIVNVRFSPGPSFGISNSAALAFVIGSRWTPV